MLPERQKFQDIKHQAKVADSTTVYLQLLVHASVQTSEPRTEKKPIYNYTPFYLELLVSNYPSLTPVV